MTYDADNAKLLTDNKALAAALSDLVDGLDAHDIVRMTGMPDARAEEIIALSQQHQPK